MCVFGRWRSSRLRKREQTLEFAGRCDAQNVYLYIMANTYAFCTDHCVGETYSARSVRSFYQSK